MKTSSAFAACAALLTTSLAFSQGRNVEPIGAGAPNNADVALAKAIGLKLGKPYSVNRAILLRASWKPDNDGTDRSRVFKACPEISCGSGYDAICQAAFSKDGKYIVLTVDQNKKELPLVHVSEE